MNNHYILLLRVPLYHRRCWQPWHARAFWPL